MRLEMGLSQVEFGERCGFYQTYLSRIENGQANPTLNAVEVIANALGLTVFELFDKIRGDAHNRQKSSAAKRSR
ncbi:XRE family transcriptional regulator [Variovorax sp. RO1]|nr:XRE family transcriptional regulator [Variovorax sp. RO1]